MMSMAGMKLRKKFSYGDTSTAEHKRILDTWNIL